MVLDDLPERFATQYTPCFVRHLVVTAVTMTGRLVQPHFGRLSCVAEELLMRLLLAQAEVTAELYGLLDDEVRTAWEVFADGLYEDFAHERLYESAGDGTDEDADVAQVEIGNAKDWFIPFNEGRFVHPFAVYEAEAKASPPGTD